ncbi:MAG: SH3 domain-containing protein [Spirochaetes bacterium]|nr:SH3 domain-containing protein [Spirochaetota bacterium]
MKRFGTLVRAGGNYRFDAIRILAILIAAILIACVPLLGALTLSADVTVLPNGILNPGDEVLVTGDHVRVRKGPGLGHEILTKVNKNTLASVLEKDGVLSEIQGMKNYWYRIKLEKSGIEGWMYGQFLLKQEKKQTEETTAPDPPSPTPTSPPKRVTLNSIGTIQEVSSLLSSGDLNKNGVSEIAFVVDEENGRYKSLVGYEKQKGRYEEAYRIKLMSSSVDKVSVLSGPGSEASLVSVCAGGYCSLYSFQQDRNALSLVYKLQSEILAMGSLDGKDTWIVSMRKNRIADNDGTETFYIEASRMEMNRDRIQLKDKIEYLRPLPVKKITAFDLDGDNKDEIVCEIGGKNSGGGITVLKLQNEKLTRLLNSGVNTYQDGQFFGMWGVKTDADKRLVLYTTEPDSSDDVNTSFGFLMVYFDGARLVQEKFFPVGPMLDDANNTRKVLAYPDGGGALPFIVLDYDQDSATHTVKAPIL